MTRLEAFEFDSFDEFADMLQNEENQKNKIKPKSGPIKQASPTQQQQPNPAYQPKPNNRPKVQSITQYRTLTTPTQKHATYRRKTTGPVVISIEEFNARAKRGEIEILHPTPEKRPEEKVQKPEQSKVEPKKAEPKKTEPKKSEPKKATEKKNIKKPVTKKVTTVDKKKEKQPKPKKETWAEKRRIKKISKKISKNLAHELRYTEPKKRNLLARIILQEKYNKGYLDYIGDEIDNLYINQRDVDESKNAKKRRDRRLYKEVQAYEDAVEDVTVRRGWLAFKVGLAASALAGIIALGNYTYKQMSFIGDIFNPPQNQIVSVYEMNEEEQAHLVSIAQSLRQSTIEADGYHFDHLTDMQIADGYNRMINYEKKMTENQFSSASMKIATDGDQALLDRIVRESFGEETYNAFSEQQRRDYKQLAFELLPTSLPDLFGERISYIRNPIIMEHLEARNNAIAKGYKMSLRVNNDEKETVRNLGTLKHMLSEMTGSEYFAATSGENGQQQFFDEVLREVLGEEGYANLSRSDKRDYEQLIYEWSTPEGKQFMKDPIAIENEERFAQSGGYEIGE